MINKKFRNKLEDQARMKRNQKSSLWRFCRQSFLLALSVILCNLAVDSFAEQLAVPVIKKINNHVFVQGKPKRVVVKYKEEGPLSPTARVPSVSTSSNPSPSQRIVQKYKASIKPLIDLPAATMQKLAPPVQSLSGGKPPVNLDNFMVVSVDNASDETLAQMAEQFKQLNEVEYVYIENLFLDPPGDITPLTPNLTANQTFFSSNPGIDAAFAATVGANGAGIRLSDCEYAWNTQHEDLVDKPIVKEANQSTYTFYEDHGTAVAGIAVGVNNAYGVKGIAPAAEMYVYPEYSNEQGFRRVTAIANAIANSRAGDVVLLEMQTVYNGTDYGPAELEPAVWTVVKQGVDKGVIVVAAAGNGQQDLDSATYAEYRSRGDSGAIIVGAGSSTAAHNPMSYTSYGNRVNVHAWGQNVFTLGYGDFAAYGGDYNQYYTASFEGTSSASALVASAVAAIQSYAVQKNGRRLTPVEMRDLIISTGIAQGAGVKIGPFINLKAALNKVLTMSTNASAPQGYHESHNCNISTGWACDADKYSQPLNISFYTDNNVFVAAGSANLSRPSAASSCGGQAAHGFSWTIPQSWKDGQTRKLYAYALGINSGGIENQQNVLLNGSPLTVTCSTVNSAPTTGSVSPINSSSVAGNEVVFTSNYADPNGWTDLQYVMFIINIVGNPANSAYVYYNQNANLMYLSNDAGTGWVGSCTPGSGTVFENSNAKLRCAGSSVTGSGTALTVKWALTLKSTLVGSKTVSLYAADDANATSGWVSQGSWTINNATSELSWKRLKVLNQEEWIGESLYVHPAGAVYAMGGDRAIWKWLPATGWVRLTVGSIKDDFHYYADNNIYGIATNNQVYRWGGSVWSKMSTQQEWVTEALHVVPSGYMYAIGSDRAIWKWAPAGWTRLTSPSIKDSFHYFADNNIYAIGTDNLIWRWNGSAWLLHVSVHPPGTQGIVEKIHVVSPSLLYGIGTDRRIWKWNGSSWSALTTPSIKDDFEFFSETNIYAIGTDNKLYRWAL